jgi:protein ImuB
MLAAIYVPDFPAEAVVRAEPGLREQAVAIVDGTPPLLHVIACNQRAREAGVELGMTQLEAEARLESRVASCELRVKPAPNLSPVPRPLSPARQESRVASSEWQVRNWQIRRRAPAQEEAAHAALIDCACAFSPRVEAETATPDTVVLDLDGLERLFGPPLKIARELAQRAAQFGLEVHVAVARNVDTAIHAARGFAGITVIPPGEEAARLGVLPVSSFEFPVSSFKPRGPNSKPETRNSKLVLDTLARWGIHTFRALAALPETAVRQRLGETGVRLQKLARGEGSRPLVPTPPPLKFEEALELEHPLTLLEPLSFLLHTMLEQLCARLAARALATQELRLNLGPESEYVLRLPVPMVNAKVFLKLLQLDLHAHPPGKPVEKIFLAADPILPRFTQGGLFLPATPEPEKLEVMLARIRKTVARPPSPVSRSTVASGESHGKPGQVRVASPHEDTNRVGTAELLDSHRPDAFRVNPVLKTVPRRPSLVSRSTVASSDLRVAHARNEERETWNVERPAGGRRATGDGERLAGNEERATENDHRETVLRRYRPPRPVRVEVKEGQPIHLFDFRAAMDPSPRSERAQGSAARNVLWASGPWRESGEWWTEGSWSRETWDIALREDGNAVIVRAFRDVGRNQWFVEAIYD